MFAKKDLQERHSSLPTSCLRCKKVFIVAVRHPQGYVCVTLMLAVASPPQGTPQIAEARHCKLVTKKAV